MDRALENSLTAPQLSKPALWIIAGPNGSGKSSAYQLLTLQSPKDTVWIINPDLLAKRIGEEETLEADVANLEAVKRIEAWLYSSVKAYQTVGVETVLSSPKYQKLVLEAKAKGFEVNLIYVYLRAAALNVERVALRVKRGGHNVPEDKIVGRRLRSFQQLTWFFKEASKAYIFDNSDAEPKLVFTKEENSMTKYHEPSQDIKESLTTAYPELSSYWTHPA